MARFQILYWQDVPSVIQAFADDGTVVKRQLPEWFQQEIDRRATSTSGREAPTRCWTRSSAS